MQKAWPENDLKEIARQLGKPDGELGLKTGLMMNRSNGAMIRRTVELLDIQDNEQILELGPGNGEHVADLLAAGSDLFYTGADISETMILEAIKMNEDVVNRGKVSFVLSNGEKLPFQNDSFHKIFTVNTIYFWENPENYAQEIYRTLKANGTFCLALAAKSFMEKLPFTKYGFQLYDKDSALKSMQSAGFLIDQVVEEMDVTIGNMGQQVEREIIILICTKPVFP